MEGQIWKHAQTREKCWDTIGRKVNDSSFFFFCGERLRGPPGIHLASYCIRYFIQSIRANISAQFKRSMFFETDVELEKKIISEITLAKHYKWEKGTRKEENEEISSKHSKNTMEILWPRPPLNHPQCKNKYIDLDRKKQALKPVFIFLFLHWSWLSRDVGHNICIVFFIFTG